MLSINQLIINNYKIIKIIDISDAEELFSIYPYAKYKGCNKQLDLYKKFYFYQIVLRLYR